MYLGKYNDSTVEYVLVNCFSSETVLVIMYANVYTRLVLLDVYKKIF